ncbi:PIN domain nuclease [Kutzneria buriramensis]|uniref:Ribonuclease VapC n=1 Tax=Kutzneria buriramensis TaxID=1045776 RepID=A0A3E0I9Z9_9PSEU|nr:PIN domain nuclease [Kutzneria buriramensis]REH55552.1 hypothetical protein BCF44_101576 [Kutzneria buriramensis]
MAVARYLADTSALARLHKAVVYEFLGPLIEAGLVAICSMVELEILYSARGKGDYESRRAQLAAGFERLPSPDEVWQRAVEVQEGLARRGSHRGVKLPDLLIAATADRHGVVLLHYDVDYDDIAAITDQPTRWVVPPGTAD